MTGAVKIGICYCSKPVPRVSDKLFYIGIVRPDIIPGNVGNHRTKSMQLFFEYQAFFGCQFSFPISPAPHVQSQFKRQIESRQVPFFQRFHSRYIMDTVFRVFNEIFDFIDPFFAAIVPL